MKYLLPVLLLGFLSSCSHTEIESFQTISDSMSFTSIEAKSNSSLVESDLMVAVQQIMQSDPSASLDDVNTIISHQIASGELQVDDEVINSNYQYLLDNFSAEEIGSVEFHDFLHNDYIPTTLGTYPPIGGVVQKQLPCV